MVRLQEVGIKCPLRLTIILGEPRSGKTTLVRALKIAACYTHGLLFADMQDDVIAWHCDPNNHSPMREIFNTNDANIKNVSEILMVEAIIYYLRFVQCTNHQIFEDWIMHHLCLSGLPEDMKTDELETVFPGFRIVYIHSKKSAKDICCNFAEKFMSNNILPIKKTRRLTCKLKAVIHFMGIEPRERASIRQQIKHPDSDVAVFIHLTENPNTETVTHHHPAHSAPMETSTAKIEDKFKTGVLPFIHQGEYRSTPTLSQK